MMPEAQVGGSHMARFFGRVGPPLLALVALLSSIFFPLPFSRRKTSCAIFPFPIWVPEGPETLKTRKRRFSASQKLNTKNRDFV